MAKAAVEVHGLRELVKIFSDMPDEVAEEFKDELTEAANPVKLAAQQKAPTTMSGMGNPKSRPWTLMRVGVSRRDVVVWVAPDLRRGHRKQSQRQKEAFVRGMQEKALDPALDENTGRVVEKIDDMIDNLSRRNGF